MLYKIEIYVIDEKDNEEFRGKVVVEALQPKQAIVKACQYVYSDPNISKIKCFIKSSSEKVGQYKYKINHAKRELEEIN